MKSLNVTKITKGFTLVEILVVISVLAVVGVIFTEIFFRSLRANSKAQFLSKIKQEGQNSITTMDFSIRSAEAVICPIIPSGLVSSSGYVLVLIKNGEYTRYSYTEPTNTTNGVLKRDTPLKTEAESIEQFLTLICQGEFKNEETSLTDDNPQSGVSIIILDNKPIFERMIRSGYRDIVTINYGVEPGVDSPNAVTEDIDPIPFTTSIGLR